MNFKWNVGDIVIIEGLGIKSEEQIIERRYIESKSGVVIEYQFDLFDAVFTQEELLELNAKEND